MVTYDQFVIGVYGDLCKVLRTLHHRLSTINIVFYGMNHRHSSTKKSADTPFQIHGFRTKRPEFRINCALNVNIRCESESV